MRVIFRVGLFHRFFQFTFFVFQLEQIDGRYLRVRRVSNGNPRQTYFRRVFGQVRIARENRIRRIDRRVL